MVTGKGTGDARALTAPADDPATAVDDAGPGSPGADAGQRLWWVLVVDDDEKVHRATRFALAGYTVDERPVEFAHAYSAAEARAILAADSDIAVVILDMVMETPDAGLRLVQVIREELALSAVRIVLRIAQPGSAPELPVIQRYDISDCKTKAELTRPRLATTLTSAIRSYDRIRAMQASREGLQKIVQACTNLFARRGMGDFCDGVLTQICAFLGIAPEGLVCAARGLAGAARQNSAELVVVGAAGQYRGRIEQPLCALGNARVEDAIRRTIREATNLHESGYTTLYVRGHADHEIAVFVDTAHPIGDAERRLIQLFAATFATGLDHVALLERLIGAAGAP